MKRKLYAIYDTRAGDIMGQILQLQSHDAVAIRDFTDIVLGANSRLAMHPDDYALVELGELETEHSANSETPVLHAGQPRIVVRASEIIDMQKRLEDR